MIKEEVDSKRRSAHRKTATSSQRPSLSTKARFRGQLVAQTSIGRLETESPSARKVPANEAVQRNSSANVAVPDSACHAGGRGFESRRSRKSPCKSGCCVVNRDAGVELTTQTVVQDRLKGRKRPAKAVRGRWFQAAFGRVERDREARATTQNGQRSRRSQTCFSRVSSRVSASRACLQERRDANSPVSRVSWGITQPPPPAPQEAPNPANPKA
jgi:hypothetical protein